MELIGIGIAITLFAVAIIHIYWALGGLWPARDEASLARAVVGSQGIVKMPNPVLTTVVALGIFAAGLVPLIWTAQIPLYLPFDVIIVLMWALAGVFLLRGLGGLVAPILGIKTEPPFTRLNLWIYSPLCLLLGAGYLSLLEVI